MSNITSEYPHGGLAIVGGGIAGVTLALGLVARGIPCKIYEQGHSFAEIGAGVAFAPNSIRAMRACDANVYTAFKAVATHNTWESKRADRELGRKGLYFDFLEGFHENDKLLFSLYNDEGANSVHRAHFLDEMVKFLPKDIAAFRKRVERVEESAGQGPVTLHFADGTSTTADAVVGADGVKSHVRQSLLGAEKPESHAGYTYKYAYRGLIPMDKAVAELGEEAAVNSRMYLGPDRHVLTFPIDKGETMNVVAFTTTSQNWPDIHKSTRAATKQDALNDFSGWGPTVTHILSLLNEDVDIWAIFDMKDHPAPTYAKGKVAIIGDAAHATSPHHGSGAGFAIEDSAVLAELLADPAAKRPSGLRVAFQAYDQCRRQRSQWLVASSRRTGELYEWQAQGVGYDIEKIGAEVHERFEKIWQGDIKQMIANAQAAFQRLLPYSEL
ncbi:salicylate hydroxylase [Mollisia scopiformis]|uniref:Salicylate hydroxylase n=1 Tax=Mollisia scopiformis TaxID=149040 RepID=A0A132BAA4_MOLSC|nr:salicylate hydroxylase [Mollisia scopiformis]KUJ08794.1 salicylate hydroxylase [Mollisia scopiformis]